MNSIEDFDEFRKHVEDLKKKKNGKPSSIDDLALEGNILLNVSGSNSPDSIKQVIDPHSKNPYIRARIDVMTKFPQWRQKEVLQMEKDNNINNYHYESFVKSVVELGDSYSK